MRIKDPKVYSYTYSGEKGAIAGAIIIFILLFLFSCENVQTIEQEEVWYPDTTINE